MPRQNNRPVEALQEAFAVFNQLSGQLAGSYHSLEAETARLNASLTASNSERMRALGEKERLAERLQKLIDLLPGGVVVLDGEERISRSNRVAAEILGEPLIGIPWAQVLERVRLSSNREGELQLEGGRRIVVAMRRLEGEPGALLLLQDVTESHRQEQLLNHRQRLAAMGEMSASMAHQIRTPLASALLYTSHLRRPGLKEGERLRITDKIHNRLKHMERMVNDMLLYARGESEVEGHLIALESLLDAFRQTLEPQLEQAGARLVIENGAAGRLLYGNPQALLGALLNLATNALQARDEGLRLRLAITAQPESITLALSDNGPGIPGALQARIFTPFVTTRSDGTGLGLAVVRSVVEAHGGSVELKSGSGEGACFAVTLPSPSGTETTGIQLRSGEREATEAEVTA